MLWKVKTPNEQLDIVRSEFLLESNAQLFTGYFLVSVTLPQVSIADP
ncbi:hypothetical protein EDF66_10411 [Sphingobacterium sp. JUb20]|nr:hypothetical protein [Sphingobacterium sp. JUb21]TCR07906.1 hypothetical protein EDF66_10411 [Sphingobacterium sp. JUb20]